jgi:hypothetical protein
MAKQKSESFYQELVRKYIAKKIRCVAVRELHLGGPAFDVVGFDPLEEEFHVVECKLTSRPVGIGQTFGQIVAYKAMIYDAGEDFLDAFERKLRKDGIGKVRFWKHGVRFVDAGRIPVRFYVALRQKACERVGMLRLIKSDLQEVGIIRITNQNACRDYIRNSGVKDYEICRSDRVDVPISMPVRLPLENILKNRNSNDETRSVTAEIDKKILALKPNQVRAVAHAKSSLYYRVAKNFVSIHPKRSFVTVRTKEEAKKWKRVRISAPHQIPSLIPRIKKSLEWSLS